MKGMTMPHRMGPLLALLLLLVGAEAQAAGNAEEPAAIAEAAQAAAIAEAQTLKYSKFQQQFSSLKTLIPTITSPAKFDTLCNAIWGGIKSRYMVCPQVCPAGPTGAPGPAGPAGARGPPGPTADLTANITELKELVDQLFNANTLLLLQNVEQQTEINKLLPGGSDSLTLAYNRSECLAKTFDALAPSDNRTWEHVFAVGQKPEALEFACSLTTASPTCADVCGQLQMKCDPCGMMFLCCKSNLYQALKWARLGSSEVDNNSAFPIFNGGPPVNSTCPSSADPEAHDPYFPVQNKYGELFARNLGFDEASCYRGSGSVVSAITNVKNFCTPGDKLTYIDPINACNIKVRVVQAPTIVSFGTVCACAK